MCHTNVCTTLPLRRVYIISSADISYQIYYGGQISDSRDLLCIAAILGDFFLPSIMDEKCFFTSKEAYHYHNEGGIGIEPYLNKLPLVDMPEVSGISDYGSQIFNTSKTNQLIENLLVIEPYLATPKKLEAQQVQGIVYIIEITTNLHL